MNRINLCDIFRFFCYYVSTGKCRWDIPKVPFLFTENISRNIINEHQAEKYMSLSA